jgi:hypothetical protein
MSEAPRDRVVRLLSAEQSPLRDELVGMVVDYALAQPLSDFVDFEQGRLIVVRALTKENLGRIFARHVDPGFARYTKRVAGSGETLGDLVPEPARVRIRRIIDQSKPPRAKWARELVDPTLLRRLFAPVWANLFASFAKRLPLPGISAVAAAAAGEGGVGATIAGRLTRSVQERAEKLVDRGRSAMGGLGAEIEKRVQAAAREFSDGAAGIFREALEARLKSAEGREIVSEIVTQALAQLVAAKLAALHDDAKDADVPEILAAAAEIIGHSVTREFIEGTIEQEVSAFVELEGKRSSREIFDELGVLDDVRRVAVSRVGGLAQNLFAAPAFAEWVARLLGA